MRKLTLAHIVNPPSTHELLRELVAHLQQNRTVLREEWARRITEAERLLGYKVVPLGEISHHSSV